MRLRLPEKLVGKPAWRVVMVCALAGAALAFLYPGNAQDPSRLGLAQSLALRGSVSIDPYAPETADKAEHELAIFSAYRMLRVAATWNPPPTWPTVWSQLGLPREVGAAFVISSATVALAIGLAHILLPRRPPIVPT